MRFFKQWDQINVEMHGHKYSTLRVKAVRNYLINKVPKERKLHVINRRKWNRIDYICKKKRKKNTVHSLISLWLFFLIMNKTLQYQVKVCCRRKNNNGVFQKCAIISLVSSHESNQGLRYQQCYRLIFWYTSIRLDLNLLFFFNPKCQQFLYMNRHTYLEPKTIRILTTSDKKKLA